MYSWLRDTADSSVSALGAAKNSARLMVTPSSERLSMRRLASRALSFQPFDDKNSVSGHTFIAAIPFLVAAREVGHAAPAWGLRALSPLTGWSRLNDERHYLSQVLLGYALAWESVQAAGLSPGESSPEAPATPE